MAKFCPLFSSSSGNSIYIGGGENSILIDIGVSAKQTEQALFNIGVDADSIRDIFITHEHSDHIKGIKVFTKKHKARLHMTAGTYEALVKTDALDNAEECSIITSDGVDVGCMLVRPFATSHDASESCGYTIELANGRKMSVATDLGVMTDTVLENLKGSDLVMLESNHDVNMLQCGGYPYILKRRILGVKGHLSNDACAETLVKLIESGTTRFFLGHLSRENNIPQLAYQTSVSALTMAGATEGEDYYIRVAKPQWDEKAMIL
ncbi:MAG: MBL fold metallo-hydrolase [Clostridia bacterium]|nr:MBL fold metallo-hydrolase [Clostridia bacterium]